MAAHSRRSRSRKPIERAVIYARVSKDDTGRGRSCKEQIDACTTDCEYEGWPVAATLMDNDRGASRHSKGERESFKRLPDVLRPGDVLVVWEPSRITRDMKAFGSFCDLLAEREVRLYYNTRTYDMDDDDDRNYVWQDILDGAKQAGKTRKRVLRSMEANVKDRKQHGRQPPGYAIERDPRTGKPTKRKVDLEQARILRIAADRALQGESMRSISRDLAEEWLSAGGRGFEPRDVKRFLTSPTTFGFRVHYGEVVGEGDWEPAVDPKLYPQLTSLLGDPKRLTQRGSEPRWLLSSIARCGVCLEMGEPGIIDHKKARSLRHGDAYYCRKFNHVARDMERVDRFVQELLLRLFEQPETLAKLEAKDDSGGAVDADLALIEQLRGEIATFMRDASKTRMSALTVAQYVEPLQDQIDAATRRVNSAGAVVDPALRRVLGPNARAEWASMTIPEQRDTIRAAAQVTIVRVGKQGRFSPIGVEVYPVSLLTTR
ncbi:MULTISPECIES: recombinase family protein [Nocardia]|uniref:recombinase family protein n=1 Tax=Nocardia TaxID=1817 RepID=UPI0024554618|nr:MULTISPECIES: recombinase family protein [Nocardia]